jgi:hypothetical protein
MADTDFCSSTLICSSALIALWTLKPFFNNSGATFCCLLQVSRTSSACHVLSDTVQPRVVNQETGAVELPAMVHETSEIGAVDPLFESAAFLTERDSWFQQVTKVCDSCSHRLALALPYQHCALQWRRLGCTAQQLRSTLNV